LNGQHENAKYCGKEGIKEMPIIDTTQYRNSFQSKPKTFEEQSSLGKEDFLRLLVTQLQNQDPTQPLQDREFIAQMTQFSTLEQMTNLNDMFTKFVEAQSIGGLSNMIGKKVTWTEYVVETNNAGEQVLKEVPKEGMVTAISMKDGKSQVVLEDGSRLDVNRIETVTNSVPKPGEKPEETPEEGEEGQQPGDNPGEQPTESAGETESQQPNEGGGA